LKWALECNRHPFNKSNRSKTSFLDEYADDTKWIAPHPDC